MSQKPEIHRARSQRSGEPESQRSIEPGARDPNC
jgi:hypothetical protein